jgi:hypothetical protein
MLLFNRWQSKTAYLMAMGMTATAFVPLLISTPAIANSQSVEIAQLFPESRDDRYRESSRGVVSSGTVIPVTYDRGKKIIVSPEETADITLTVAEDVESESGRIAIPAGSRIEGELRPTNRGTQFVAQNLILEDGDRDYPIEATSREITDTEIINERSNPDILKGAVIGAAAGAVLGEIFGGIDLGEVLAGAGVGVLGEVLLRGRKQKEVEVVVVRPDTDLDLRLEEDFVATRVGDDDYRDSDYRRNRDSDYRRRDN